MGQILVQNQAGSLTVYLHASDGEPVTDLVFSTFSVDYKAPGASAFVAKTLVVEATASIGSGVDGSVALTAVDAGADGNDLSVEVTIPVGTSPLTVSQVGDVITVALAVNAGVVIPADNTATLVAAAINTALATVDAVASGTGADSLSIADTATFSGGVSYLTELGDGFYEVSFTAVELATTGNLIVKARGTGSDVAVLSAYIAASAPSTSTGSISSPPSTVSLFGWLYDVMGEAVEGASVSFRVLDTPSVVSNCVAGAVLSTETQTTSTDSTGFFSIDLVVGANVDVFIPAANYRRIVTVPSENSNIFDIA